MKHIAAFLVLASLVFAGEPRIVGTPADATDGTIRVQVNTPPWIDLSLKDAPEGSVQTWAGPIGEGEVGRKDTNGVAMTTGVPGTYKFRVIVQVPSDGVDPIEVYESTVIVTGQGPQPVPPPPVEDFATTLTKAVQASPKDSHAGLSRAANAYALVADQIKSGLLAEPSQVTTFTDAVVGLVPEYSDIKSKIVDPHVASLKLAKASDYEPVWRQIAAAIKAGLTDIPPPPDPVDPPIPVTSLHVLIIEETADRNTLPASQVAIFTSTKVRKWLEDSGAKWRMWDKDVDATRDEQVWRDALKIERGSLPWIIVSNGSKGFSGPLPNSADETITLMGKYK